jgi:5-methylcytosine-specific restriction enzyme A
MITPADHKLIFLVTGSSGRQHGYEDHWSEDGSTFFYFGEGQVGDMKFTKGNLALREHVTHGEDVHLFEEVPTKKGYLRYRGQMVCTGSDFSRRSRHKTKHAKGDSFRTGSPRIVLDGARREVT